MSSNIVRFDSLRFVTAATIAGATGAFVPIGTPLGHAMRVLHFINQTDQNMIISFDGTTSNIFLGAGSFALYDLTSDQDGNESFRYQVGTQLYVTYATNSPASGEVFLVAIYGKGE